MGLIRTIAILAVLGATGCGGWLAGSFFPAPDALKKLVGAQVERLGGMDPARLSWVALSEALPADRLAMLRQQASEAAAQAGEVIAVERSTAEQFVEFLEPVPVPAPIPAPISAPGPGQAPPAQGASKDGPLALSLCPRMTVSNAPKPGALVETIVVQGVALRTNPTLESCLSSGFGPRNGRTHRGLDFHNGEGGPILAAGDGVVIEKKYRDDFGNMLLIDHGGGVFTRYAHLASFREGIAPGARVAAGEEIGLMGNTAAYRIPIHLHFELLLGDYANPKGSFGLEAKDPFGFSRAE